MFLLCQYMWKFVFVIKKGFDVSHKTCPFACKMYTHSRKVVLKK